MVGEGLLRGYDRPLQAWSWPLLPFSYPGRHCSIITSVLPLASFLSSPPLLLAEISLLPCSSGLLALVYHSRSPCQLSSTSVRNMNREPFFFFSVHGQTFWSNLKLKRLKRHSHIKPMYFRAFVSLPSIIE